MGETRSKWQRRGRRKNGSQPRESAKKRFPVFKLLVLLLVLAGGGVFLSGSAPMWIVGIWASATGSEDAAGTEQDQTRTSSIGVEGPVQVEVLNGAGEPGLADQVASKLLDLGYDVVSVDNADHFEYPVTHVIDRSGNTRAARNIAVYLGFDSVKVEPDPNLFLDATVIIGGDWEQLDYN